MIRKSAIWALDLGAEQVRAVAAQERTPGEWVILGEGTARSLGFSGGTVTKVTDAVEAVVGAVREAEARSETRCTRLFFSYDDPGMINAHPMGSKTLAGEGQIQRMDAREAVLHARRLVGDYERIPVYSREVQYIIDGKDTVGNPYGIFGHRLEVQLHVVLSRATHFQAWLKVMERAGYREALPVLSLAASGHSVLDRKNGPQVLWDLGRDICSGGIFDRGTLREYGVFLTEELSGKEIARRVRSMSQAWVNQEAWPLAATGDLAGSPLAAEIAAEAGSGFRWLSPSGIGSLNEPSCGTLAGLLMMASESARSAPGPKLRSGWVAGTRSRMHEMIREYF